MNWTPIDQQMPRPGKRVLVRFLNGEREIPRITIGRYLPKHFEDASTCDNDPEEWAEVDANDNMWWPEGWWEDVCIAECVDRIPKVTHWMPLPNVHILNTLTKQRYETACTCVPGGRNRATASCESQLLVPPTTQNRRSCNTPCEGLPGKVGEAGHHRE